MGLSSCSQRVAQGLPEPEFVSTPYEFKVTFRKDPYTPERLRALGLSDRQAQAVLFVRERGSISNAEFRDLTGVSDRTALRDLDGLVEAGVFTRASGGRQARYSLRGI
jgi:ATP-dependent DNA helicase RecG